MVQWHLRESVAGERVSQGVRQTRGTRRTDACPAHPLPSASARRDDQNYFANHDTFSEVRNRRINVKGAIKYLMVFYIIIVIFNVMPIVYICM